MDKLKDILREYVTKSNKSGRWSVGKFSDIAQEIIEYMDDKPEALLKRLKDDHDDGMFPGCGI